MGRFKDAFEAGAITCAGGHIECIIVNDDTEDDGFSVQVSEHYGEIVESQRYGPTTAAALGLALIAAAASARERGGV